MLSKREIRTKRQLFSHMRSQVLAPHSSGRPNGREILIHRFIAILEYAQGIFLVYVRRADTHGNGV